MSTNRDTVTLEKPMAIAGRRVLDTHALISAVPTLILKGSANASQQVWSAIRLSSASVSIKPLSSMLQHRPAQISSEWQAKSLEFIELVLQCFRQLLRQREKDL